MDTNVKKIKEVRQPTVIRGIGVGRGVAIGPLRFDRLWGKGKEKGTEACLATIRLTADMTAEEIRAMREKAVRNVGEEHGEIFDLYLAILRDGGGFAELALQFAEDGDSPEVSALKARDTLSRKLEDETGGGGAMSSHVSRLCSIFIDLIEEGRRRISEEISKEETESREEACEKFILVSSDSSPEAIPLLRRADSPVIGLVCTDGSENSALASYGRLKGLPTVVLAGEDKLSEKLEGAGAIVDAAKGRLTVNPDLADLDRFSESVREADEVERRLSLQIGLPSVTRSGRHVSLFSVAHDLRELEDAIAADAEGIGILSTDPLFQPGISEADEEAQYRHYCSAIEIMRGKPLAIRTYSGGRAYQSEDECQGYRKYPGMGQTGVRFSLANRPLFKLQLRAILRAAAKAELTLLIPGVVSAEELRRVKAVMIEVAGELKSEEIPFGDTLKLGVMIDTPGAAVMADELSKEVDICIADTDRLLPLTLSADPHDPSSAEIMRRNPEAVLRLVGHICSAFHLSGRTKKAGVCGDLACDPSLTERLISLGADFLSVPPPYVLEIREKIRECPI